MVRASGTGATPTGTVQFIDSNTGNVLAQGSLNSSGTVSVQTTTIPAGYYYVVAQYGGDAGYAPSTSDGMGLEVDAKTAGVSLTSSLSTVTAGGTVSLSALVTSTTSGTPTGNVLFQVDGVTATTVALQNGTAASVVTIATPGQHVLRAVYVGDGVFGQAVSAGVPLSAHGALLQFVPGAATTVAGTPSDANHGGFSGDGGAATAATMHTPSGVIADAAGNLYIADEQNNVIRKVAVDGTISTYAGTPYAGNVNYTRFGGDGGPAVYAYLTNPVAIALDAGNNLYIADYSNHAVRRVDATTGIISTFAGVGGTPGYNQDSGPATTTRLNHPSALAFDAAGNLYIADTGNNLVRKVDMSGKLTTIAGRYGYSGSPVEGGQATMQVLTQPMGVAVDTAGNVYIADTSVGFVRRVDPSGKMYTFAGSASFAVNQGDGGPATAATLKNPQQMAFDLAGNLYIADPSEGAVRKVDPSGIITTVAGSYTSQAQASHYDPAGSAATLVSLIATSGVGVAPDGSLLVTDDYDQTVWRVGPTGIVQFGPQAAGTTSDAQAVTLFNAGDRPLVFAATPYAVTGDYVVSAGGTAPCNFTAQLAVGASCTVAVQYRPQTGVLHGSIVFAGAGLGSPTITLITNNSVASTTTQLYLSATTLNYGDQLLIYGQVAPATNGPTPSGEVSFFDASTLLGSASLSSGAGYIYNSTLTVGSHSVTAVYGGDGYYGTSTSDPMVVTVSGTATQTLLSVSSTAVSAGTSVILTATVSTGNTPLGSGGVMFFDGSAAVGTSNVNANGVAVLTTPGLSSGSHSFTAIYAAQGMYGGSTSTAVVVTASGGGGGSSQGLDYALSVSPLPIVLHRGETMTVAVSATQIGANYQGSVPLACGTLPSYVTCSFSPATLIIGGPVQNLTSLLTITLSAGYATNSRPVKIDRASLVRTTP